MDAEGPGGHDAWTPMVRGRRGCHVCRVHARGRGERRDHAGPATRLVTVSLGGKQQNGYGAGPSLSADGRYLAYFSWATNLVRGDHNGWSDVFLWRRTTGTTRLVSVRGATTSGQALNQASYYALVSPDGRFVIYNSDATNLMPGVEQGLYIRDRRTAVTGLLSRSSNGAVANGWTGSASISADDRFVVFQSDATNLVRHDTNRNTDIFVRDRSSGTVRRVSVSRSGVEADSWSRWPMILSERPLHRLHIRGDQPRARRHQSPRGRVRTRPENGHVLTG